MFDKSKYLIYVNYFIYDQLVDDYLDYVLVLGQDEDEDEDEVLVLNNYNNNVNK